MLYSILADITVLLHLGFLLFAIFGGLLALWRIGWAWVHVPAFAWGVYIMLAGGICPLTPLENWFRRQAGEEAYGGAFIDYYIMPLIYPPGLTRRSRSAWRWHCWRSTWEFTGGWCGATGGVENSY